MHDLDRASDPATPASDLRELAASADQAVRLAVASNPSAPAAALSELAHRFPGAVARNPSCPSWFPSEETWTRVLERPECPAHVVDAALEAPTGRWIEAIATNPGLSGEQVRAALNVFLEVTDMDFLDSDFGTQLLQDVAQHPALPQDLARDWVERYPIAEHLAANPMLPRDLLESLAEHPDDFVRQQARRSLERHGRPYADEPLAETMPD